MSIVLMWRSCLTLRTKEMMCNDILDVVANPFNMSHLDFFEDRHTKYLKLYGLFYILQNNLGPINEVINELKNIYMGTTIYVHLIVLLVCFMEEKSEQKRFIDVIMKSTSDDNYDSCRDKINSILSTHLHNDVDDIEILVLHCLFNKDKKLSKRCMNKIHSIGSGHVLHNKDYRLVQFVAKCYDAVIEANKLDIYTSKDNGYTF